MRSKSPQARVCLAGGALAVLLLTLAAGARAGAPDWVRGWGKSSAYPRDTYLTGFGCSEEEDLNSALASAQAAARNDLACFFQTSLCSLFSSARAQHGDQASQFVKSNVMSLTRLQLLGVRVEPYVDREEKRACALAVMEIAEARRVYLDRRSRIRGEIETRVRNARGAEGQGRAMEAVENYLATYPLFAAGEEVDAVLLVLGQSAAGSAPAGEPPAPDRASVSAAVDRLLNQRCASLNDVAAVLACRLSRQVQAGPVTVAPFTYRETEFTSEFSRHLAEVLRVKLTANQVNAEASEGVRVRSLGPGTEAPSPSAPPVVSGTYVDKGEELMVLAVLSNPVSGERLGAADTSVPLAAVAREGLAIRPANFTEAMADQRVFCRNELVTSGLSVQAWTSKGERNLALRQGENYRVYLRVSQPAYVRMLYHLASGQRVLVPILGQEEYFIDTSKVNKVVELPEAYEVVAPFGVEVLQVIASSSPLPPPPTRTQTIEGQAYQVLRADTEKDLEEAVCRMRGIRVASPEETGRPAMAEARVTLTTMR